MSVFREDPSLSSHQNIQRYAEFMKENEWTTVAAQSEKSKEFYGTNKFNSIEQESIKDNFKYGHVGSVIKVIDIFASHEKGDKIIDEKKQLQTLPESNQWNELWFNDDTIGAAKAVRYFCFRASQYQKEFRQNQRNNYMSNVRGGRFPVIVSIIPQLKTTKIPPSYGYDYLRIERWMRGQTTPQQVICDISYFGVEDDRGYLGNALIWQTENVNARQIPSIIPLIGLQNQLERQQREIDKMKNIISFLHETIFAPGTGLMYGHYEKSFTVAQRHTQRGGLDDDDSEADEDMSRMHFDR
jgi:hypothetical protein